MLIGDLLAIACDYVINCLKHRFIGDRLILSPKGSWRGIFGPYSSMPYTRET